MESQIAWFAGVLEAEGSISAQVYTLPDGRVRITPYICVANCDQGIIDQCFETIAALATGERAGPRICGHAGTNKPCQMIRLDGPSVEPILRSVLPHMRSEKKRNAQTLLNYIESRREGLLLRDKLGRIQRVGYTREQVEMVCSIRTHKAAKSLEAICEAPNVV